MNVVDNDGDLDKSGPPHDGVNPYLDAAERLEYGIDNQIAIINGIDDKAEHVTRLIGILIGLVFTVLSLIANFEPVEFETVTTPVEVSFAMGIFSLVLAMAAAIITYLSSKFRIGLHYRVGDYLRQPNTETSFDVHIRRVVGSYATIIKENRRVIEVNSNRFRRTLYLLLTGVLFLTSSGSLYLGRVSPMTAWATLAGVTMLAITSGWYILGSKYLTLSPIDDANE